MSRSPLCFSFMTHPVFVNKEYATNIGYKQSTFIVFIFFQFAELDASRERLRQQYENQGHTIEELQQMNKVIALAIVPPECTRNLPLLPQFSFENSTTCLKVRLFGACAVK